MSKLQLTDPAHIQNISRLTAKSKQISYVCMVIKQVLKMLKNIKSINNIILGKVELKQKSIENESCKIL